MTQVESNIVLDVDLCNPGQFFACCGVLELASRLWPESEGWFRGEEFHVAMHVEAKEAPLVTIVRRIREADPLVAPAPDADAFDEKIAPLMLRPFDVRLDWWLRPGGVAEADAVFKLWSGQQKPSRIFSDLHQCVRRMPAEAGRDLLSTREPMTGRFGFDPGAAWEALDVGFSPNEQGFAVLTAPATEILAAVGLQGFRPLREALRALGYAVWAVPLPVAAARAAASGALGGRCFRFSVVNRGKYKAFGFAEEAEKGDKE